MQVTNTCTDVMCYWRKCLNTVFALCMYTQNIKNKQIYIAIKTSNLLWTTFCHIFVLRRQASVQSKLLLHIQVSHRSPNFYISGSARSTKFRFVWWFPPIILFGHEETAGILKREPNHLTLLLSILSTTVSLSFMRSLISS